MMLRTRKYLIKSLPFIIGVFSLMLVVSQVAGSYDPGIQYSILDFEDHESNEEPKPLKLIEDYNLLRTNMHNLQQSFILSSIQYRKFAVEHSLEVFIEVVTPPPEV